MEQSENADAGISSAHGPRSFLARMIERLDLHLRLEQGVVEYSASPHCIFRLQLIESPDDFTFSDGARVRAGDRLLDLHIWNEHVPLIGKSGPTVAFARRLDRCIDASLLELTGFLRERADLDDVRAIRGNLVLGSKERSSQIARIAARYGFERVARSAPLSVGERLHRFGENILISMLVFARNPGSLRADTLWRDRTLTYLSRRRLEQRYVSRIQQSVSPGRGPPHKSVERLNNFDEPGLP
jgi:hypothetical protein